MTYTTKFEGSKLILDGPTGRHELSQGQCAAIAVMAETYIRPRSTHPAEVVLLRCELANEKAFRQEDRQTLEIVKANLAAMTERFESLRDNELADERRANKEMDSRCRALANERGALVQERRELVRDLAAMTEKAERHRQDHSDAARAQADAEWKLTEMTERAEKAEANGGLMPFGFGEGWTSGFPCRHPGCTESTSAVWLNATELRWMWDNRHRPHNEIIAHILKDFGIARCSQHRPADARAEADALRAENGRLEDLQRGSSRTDFDQAQCEITALKIAVHNCKLAQDRAEAERDALKASPGVVAIALERQRQISAEGWTLEHDDEHHSGELALAASCYAQWSTFDQTDRRHATIDGWLYRETGAPRWWPMGWSAKWWKPSIGIPRRDLEKAGALIAAEIDRLERAAANDAKS